jgi:hypothetical protein
MVGSSIVYYLDKRWKWWFQTFFLIFRIYGIILPIPIDFHIFQNGDCTTKQKVIGTMFTNVAIPNWGHHRSNSSQLHDQKKRTPWWFSGGYPLVI